MRPSILTLAVLLTAVTFVLYAGTAANAEEPDPLLIVKWGRTYGEAEQRAYQQAENYEPYEEVDKQFGWDPTHIPHNYQYYCKLWIIPLPPVR